jgi:MFS family permease
LIDAAGTGLAAVCLPFYAVKVGGLNAYQVGIALSVAGVCELAAAVPKGAVAGRYGVKRVVILNKLIQAAAYMALAYSHGLPSVLILCAAVGVGRSGGGGLNQSLVAGVLRGEQRGTILGVVRALRNVGYLASGSAGGLLLSTGSSLGLRGALLANAVSFMVGAWLVNNLHPQAQPAQPAQANWSILGDRVYLALICCAAMFGSSIVVLDVGLPLWILRHQNIPTWTTGLFVTINTLLVVLLQVSVSKRIETIPTALQGLRKSAFAFCGMAVLLALSPVASPALATVIVGAAAIAVTFGELLESPSWWTLAYELAPEKQRDQYLASFDLCWGLVGIAGPIAMSAIVALGTLGWAIYGVAMLLAMACAKTLGLRRYATMPQPLASPS